MLIPKNCKNINGIAKKVKYLEIKEVIYYNCKHFQ